MACLKSHKSMSECSFVLGAPAGRKGLSQRPLAGLCILITALVVLIGCLDGLSSQERKAFVDAQLVFQYFPRSPDGSVSFQAGPYRGGTAIVAGKDVAFWVKDGKAYTVSEAAREVAPELAQAPHHVKYDDAFIDAAYIE